MAYKSLLNNLDKQLKLQQEQRTRQVPHKNLKVKENEYQ